MTKNTRSIWTVQRTPRPSWRAGGAVEVETTEAGAGTRTAEDVGGAEAEVGEKIGDGEGISVGSNTGMTETETETGAGIETGTETETEMGTRGMEVGINHVTTKVTTPIIRDHIMTATDLYPHLSDVVSICSIPCLTTCVCLYDSHCHIYEKILSKYGKKLQILFLTPQHSHFPPIFLNFVQPCLLLNM